MSHDRFVLSFTLFARESRCISDRHSFLPAVRLMQQPPFLSKNNHSMWEQAALKIIDENLRRPRHGPIPTRQIGASCFEYGSIAECLFALLELFRTFPHLRNAPEDAEVGPQRSRFSAVYLITPKVHGPPASVCLNSLVGVKNVCN
jgi:hypothetical protein